MGQEGQVVGDGGNSRDSRAGIRWFWDGDG